MLSQECGHIAGKDIGGHIHLVAPVEIEQVRPRPRLAHQRIEPRQKRRILVVPDYHIAIGTEQHGTKRVMRVPQLHIGAVGRIADIERIEQQQPGIVPRPNRRRQPLPAEFPHRGQIRQFQPRHRPFAIGQLRRSNFHPVGVIGRAIAQRAAPAWINLARVSVVSVHRQVLRHPDCDRSPGLARSVATSPMVAFGAGCGWRMGHGHGLLLCCNLPRPCPRHLKKSLTFRN